MKYEGKAFCNHKANGVNLVFPNGNWISTIWSRGSYTENHDFGDNMSIPEAYDKLIEGGSSSVEIMIGTRDTRLYNRIFRKLNTNPENGVIGWVSILDWLWVLNQLAR